MTLTLMFPPTLPIINLTIFPMMLVPLPAVISVHKEQDVFLDDTTKNFARPSNSVMTIPLTASPSSYKKSGKKDKICLQRQHFWAFTQKLQYSRIGSSCSGFNWITALLYKLSMTIWTLWQFHNDSVCSSTSAWQLLLGVLH